MKKKAKQRQRKRNRHHVVKDANESQQKPRKPLPSDAPPEDDGYSKLRQILGEIADQKEEWAGIPMPLDNATLVIEPTYPSTKLLMEIGKKEEKVAENTKIRNVFYSHKKGRNVIIFEDNSKIVWGTESFVNHSNMQLETLGVSDAWGMEQEINALQLLEKLIKPRQFKQYFLTGSFLESSKRSGIVYMFRKLRPTLAISTTREEARLLCALCMHPIGYYNGTWGGSMCPTDDVIAHLMLMRGDEHMLWRRANQHPPWRPECGL
jgi:hypothetical protein